MSTTIVRPSGDSAVAFTPFGGGVNWDEVSEVTPDEESSYNDTLDSTETDVDMFTFPDPGIDSGDIITSVILTARARDTGGGQATLYLRVNHDSLYESAAQSLTTSYVDKIFDVTGSEGWIPGDFVSGITIGYRVGGGSSSRFRRPTQVFMTIIHAPGVSRRIFLIT